MKDIIKWYDGDLTLRLMLGMRYCERILSHELDMRPHFAYTRHREKGEGFAHGCPGTLMQHAVGRGMDLMYNFEKHTGTKISPRIESAYVKHFWEHLDEEFGMCLEFVNENDPWRIELHNVRETVEALNLLIELRDDGMAYETIEKILTGIPKIVSDDGRRFEPAKAVENGVIDKFTGSIGAPQPMTAGRLTGPLTQYYKLTGDKRALEIAHNFALGTLDCFTDDGEMLESAGTHIHSVTSALSGAAEYAALTDDSEMLSKMERLYENPLGLPVIMTDFGWIKEQIRIPGQVQGEVNQIGDMVSFCIALGKYFSDTKWFSRAETFMRGGVLPSQVLNSDFIKADEKPASDHTRDIPTRILGGYGFPMPASHLENEGSPINTLDITQGANQSICRVIENIVTVDKGILSINMLFSCDNRYAKIISSLPNTGEISILPKKAGPVRVRIPENIVPQTLTLRIDGTDMDYNIDNGWMCFVAESYDMITVTWNPQTTVYHSNYIDTDYTVKKFGEQTVSVTPIDGIYPMYDETDFINSEEKQQ